MGSEITTTRIHHSLSGSIKTPLVLLLVPVLRTVVTADLDSFARGHTDPSGDRWSANCTHDKLLSIRAYEPAADTTELWWHGYYIYGKRVPRRIQDAYRFISEGQRRPSKTTLLTSRSGVKFSCLTPLSSPRMHKFRITLLENVGTYRNLQRPL